MDGLSRSWKMVPFLKEYTMTVDPVLLDINSILMAIHMLAILKKAINQDKVNFIGLIHPKLILGNGQEDYLMAMENILVINIMKDNFVMV